MSTRCAQVLEERYQCERRALYVMRWPGATANPICQPCSARARELAQALGFELDLRPVGPTPGERRQAALARRLGALRARATLVVAGGGAGGDLMQLVIDLLDLYAAADGEYGGTPHTEIGEPLARFEAHVLEFVADPLPEDPT